MLPISGKVLDMLIPQKSPFVFVSVLQDVGEASCVTHFQFSEHHTLCSGKCLSEAGILEHMAQSAGCKLGYDDHVAGRPPRIGFIGEMKDVIINRLPLAGETVSTQVMIERQVYGSVVVVFVESSDSSGLIASCRMKIFFSS